MFTDFAVNVIHTFATSAHLKYEISCCYDAVIFFLFKTKLVPTPFLNFELKATSPDSPLLLRVSESKNQRNYFS